MAMIKCPECGKEISDKAEKCMNCGVELTDELKFAGYKLMQAKKEDHQYGLVAILFALLIPIVGLVLGIVGVVKKERFSVYCNIHVRSCLYSLLVHILAVVFRLKNPKPLK